MIVCVAVPYFAAQIERRDDARLVRTPLAIGGQPWETDPIFAFSQEVARRGVRPGTPLRQAHLLAPQAHFMPAHPPHYQQTSAEMRDVLIDFSSLVELVDLWQPPAPADDVSSRRLPAHYFVNLGDMAANELIPLTQQMGRAVREQTRLLAAIGAAPQRFTAQVAATAARLNHIRAVNPGAEQAFLASCSLRFLPLDNEARRRLRLLGLRTLGDLACLPPTALKAQFGQGMARLQQWAQGGDDTPVQPGPETRTETVAYQFDVPLTSLPPLTHLLHQAAQELAARLRAAALQARKLCLAWETETGPQQPQEQTFRQPTATASHLADTLMELVRQSPFASGITALTVSVTDLTPATPQQLTLFSPSIHVRQEDEMVRDIAAKHPLSRFCQAALTATSHPLPERRFHLRARYDPSLA